MGNSVIETRNDFTLAELNDAVHEGQSVVTTYKMNPDYDAQYAAWRALSQSERSMANYPSRYLSDKDGNWLVESEEIVDEPMGHELFTEGGALPGIGHFKPVTYGNLGDGHEAWSVIKHEESGRTFIQWGYYSSWDSSSWDGDLVEVEPVEVTVTRFKDKKSGRVYTDPTVWYN